jgi:hypothetical protein
LNSIYIIFVVMIIFIFGTFYRCPERLRRK